MKIKHLSDGTWMLLYYKNSTWNKRFFNSKQQALMFIDYITSSKRLQAIGG